MKKYIIELFHRLGILRFILQKLRPGTVTIFMIHGVVGGEPSDWAPAWRRHTIDELDFIIKTLRQYFRIVSMSAAVEYLSQNSSSSKEKLLVLTFDDGYKNNLTSALPVLQKHGAPAIFHLATAGIENGEPYWIDRLDYLFQHVNRTTLDVKIGPVMFKLDMSNRANYEKSYRALRLKLKREMPSDKILQEEIEKFASSLEMETSVATKSDLRHDKWAGLMSEADLSTMPASIEFGAHTVNHKRVNAMSIEELMSELEGSKAYIEKHSGRPCKHFCYPNGDYSDEAARCIEKQGYDSAVTTEMGINQVGDDLFKLKRVPMPFGLKEGNLLYQMINKIC